MMDAEEPPNDEVEKVVGPRVTPRKAGAVGGRWIGTRLTLTRETPGYHVYQGEVESPTSAIKTLLVTTYLSKRGLFGDRVEPPAWVECTVRIPDPSELAAITPLRPVRRMELD